MIELAIIAGSLLAFGVLILLTYRNGRKAGGDSVKAATNATAAETAARMAEAAAGLPVSREDRAQRAREGGL